MTAWRRVYGAIARSACQDAGTALKGLTASLYDSHRADGLDHWLAHCAVLAATGLPKKDIAFDGKAAPQRRQKGLISVWQPDLHGHCPEKTGSTAPA